MKEHKIFTKFNLYEEIVKQNYMYHKELIEVAQKRLQPKSVNKPLFYLDLGCGDAYFISQVYTKDVPVNYTGVDLSESALNDANKNLQDYKKWNIDLRHSDLLSHIRNDTTKYDIISCGFSLHHLSKSDKRAVFGEIKKSLVQGGLFLFYDVVRDKETREEINRIQIDHYKKKWISIPKDSMKLVEEHMIKEDFPEKLTTYQDWSKEVGFSQSEILYRTPHEFYVFIEFKN